MRRRRVPEGANCGNCKKWKTARCKIKTVEKHNLIDDCWEPSKEMRRGYDKTNKFHQYKPKTSYRVAIDNGCVRPKKQSAQI